MSNGVVALIAIASVLAYFVGTGVTYALTPDEWREKDRFDFMSMAAWSTPVWPLVLAALLGRWLVKVVRDRIARIRVPKATARDRKAP